MEYVVTNPSYKEVFQPSVTTIANEKVYDAIYFVTTTLPLEIMHSVAKLPYVGNKS
jgi:hypothetical protein